MAYGKDPADRVPAPDKIRGRAPMSGGEEGDEMPGESEADEDADKAEAISKMQDVMNAFKSGDAEAACDAMDLYIDAANRRKK